MTKVSIIIATYNSGSTIRTALESVRKQTFLDWECLVVDGASKDDTIAIVKEYCENDGRFRFVSERDHGIYDAFNKGWRKAKGKWVYYLGSDDTLTENGLSQVAEQLEDQYAVVTGDVYLIRDDGTKRLFQMNGFIGCHQGVIMQRDVLEQMKGFDERYKIIADYDLMIRTKNDGYRSKNIRVPLANFFVGGESQKLSSQWEKMKERYWIYRRNQTTNHPFMKSFIEYMSMSLALIYRKSLNCLK